MNFKSLMDTAVFSKLSGSTALVTALGGTAVYKNQAPDNQPLPYVIWNWQSAVDENMTLQRSRKQEALTQSLTGCLLVRRSLLRDLQTFGPQGKWSLITPSWNWIRQELR
jgi:hypothetical protein